MKKKGPDYPGLLLLSIIRHTDNGIKLEIVILDVDQLDDHAKAVPVRSDRL